MDQLHTPLCDLLGIEHPILSAALGGGCAGPALAAAVSEAGGFGLLGMGGLPPKLIGPCVAETRALTDRPFGAGLILPLLQGGEIEACLDAEVSTVLLFWGDPSPHLPVLHGAGIRVLTQVGSTDEAKAAVDAGVDVVVAQGVEAGGHVRATRPLAEFLPAVVEAVAPTPVVAAGGIADGRDVVAALRLGAQATLLGTRFVASEESDSATQYKSRILDARASDTVLTKLFDVGWPDAAHRVLRNRALEEWEAAGCPAPGTRPDEGGTIGTMHFGDSVLDVPRYFVGQPGTTFRGDVEHTALYAGESCERIREVKPAAAIVRDLVEEATAALGTPG